MKSRYAKYGLAIERVLQIEPCLFHVVQAGRCHSKSTLFRAHLFETHMQFNKSCGLLSFENMPIRTSAGRRFAGGTQTSSVTAIS
jgi:hypothetical protein